MSTSPLVLLNTDLPLPLFSRGKVRDTYDLGNLLLMVTTDRISMFDHLLEQVGQHGVFDIKLSATGDDPHHLIEDIAICLGRAFNEAPGEKRGIVRMGNATVPMDDALATVVVDIGGRGYTVL
ncbi:unnamed protein product, partial [marine sediment metagenome]